MRVFGWIFIVAGVAFAAVSLNAVLDPESLFSGWERFQKDPWGQGVLIGGVVTVLGAVLWAAAPKMQPDARIWMGRIIAVLVFGFIGFALFAPFGITEGCLDSPTGGGCRTQSWSTVTGLTFDGDVFYTPGLLAGGAFAALTAAVIAWRSRTPS